MAKTNVYSLSDYILTIKVGSNVPNIGGKTLSIGGAGTNGNGSFIGQIRISRNKDDWETAGDVTGSWVHNKNLDRTGKITVNIKQVSDDVIRLIQLCNTFKDNQDITEGLTITVSPDNGSSTSALAIGEDCYIVKIPDQVYGSSADMQDWEFTCGKVTYPVSTKW